LTLTWELGVAVTYLSTKRREKRERAYPASTTNDPLRPVIVQHISKASYNTFNNIPCLENTDRKPDDLNKKKPKQNRKAKRKLWDRKCILKIGKSNSKV